MQNPLPTQGVPINPGELCLVLLTLAHGAGQGPGQTKVLSCGAEHVYFVWQSGRVGGGGHYDNSLETSVRKEQGVFIVDKLESVCLGHGLVSVSQPGSQLRRSIIQFSLLQFN